jgi:hypothetical protein
MGFRHPSAHRIDTLNPVRLVLCTKTNSLCYSCLSERLLTCGSIEKKIKSDKISLFLRPLCVDILHYSNQNLKGNTQLLKTMVTRGSGTDLFISFGNLSPRTVHELLLAFLHEHSSSSKSLFNDT